MILSAEITLYPFNEDYLPPIKAYIEKLNQYPDIQVETYPTATVVMGEYNRVMDVIRDSIAWSHENFGKVVFITKFIPGYQAL